MTMAVPEIEDAKLILNFGYNGADSHPIVQRRIVRAKQKGCTIITVDPRVTEAARISDMHLQLKGGTNVALVNAMCNVIYTEGLQDQNFIDTMTTGYDDFVKIIQKYTPEYAETICKVPADLIREAARTYAKAPTAMILYGMGVCQFGQAVDVVKALGSLALMTGNYGKPASGIGPVRGQNNVQGACDMGALPNNYPGYQKVTDDAVREKFEKAWGVKLSPNNGIPLTHVPNRVLVEKDPKKQIHGYYIFGEDPAQSDPDVGEVREALEKCDFVVMQDIFMNKTGEFADVILPSTAWNEHDGVYSSCDRGFQRIRKVVEPPKDVKTDWEIICEVSTAMGYPMHYNNTEEIWNEMIDLSPKFTGATYEKIEKYGMVQWPCTSKDMSDKGTVYLHRGKFANADGKGKFYTAEWRPPIELENEEYPLSFCTVREVGHYSVRTMTGNCRTLRNLEDEPGWIQMNPADCKELGIKHGDLVKVLNKRGWCITRCNATERVAKGATYMTYQWWIGCANELTIASNLDPVSNTPEYKYCNCRVEKIDDQDWAWNYVNTTYKDLRNRMGIKMVGEEA